MAWDGDLDMLIVLDGRYEQKAVLRRQLKLQGHTEALLREKTELIGRLTLDCNSFISTAWEVTGEPLSQPALRAWVCGRTAWTARAA